MSKYGDKLESRELLVAFPPYGAEAIIKMMVHSKSVCDHPCALHTPSDHHMKNWRLCLRMDRADRLIERKCEHGTGHPDPDSLGYIASKMGFKTAITSGTHGCDFCCNPPVTQFTPQPDPED